MGLVKVTNTIRQRNEAMRELTTMVEIEAGPDEVWEVLTDFASFPEWNPFIVEVDGAPTTGERLEVTMSPPGGSRMTFRPTVTESSPHEVFEWLGTVLIRGLFDGRHRFELTPTGTGTRLTQSEEFSGLLVPLLWKKLDVGTRAGFEAMNEALRARVEKRFQG
jgi:hypothetical protein